MNSIDEGAVAVQVGPMQQTAARIVAIIRAGEGIWLVPMAVATAVPPVSLAWLMPVLVVFAAWSAVYARIAVTRGLVAWLVVGDVAVTAFICLLNVRLVPLDRVPDGSGWVATAASLCVVSLPLAWPAKRSLPAGLLVVAAFFTGTSLAGHLDSSRLYTPIITGQLAAAAVVMALVRRAARSADNTLAAAHQTRRRAAVDWARRRDEAAQLRLLHDTALTTLTMIGTGAVTKTDSLVLRAATDLSVIERITTDADHAPQERIELDQVLADAARDHEDNLTIALSLDPCQVPAAVGKAIVGAVDEALRNVARHAGTDAACLTLRVVGDRVVVEVSDQGRGFLSQIIPTHRFGVRESIVARMLEVDGKAIVDSTPNAGTRWSLEWSHDRG